MWCRPRIQPPHLPWLRQGLMSGTHSARQTFAPAADPRFCNRQKWLQALTSCDCNAQRLLLVF
eukprot:1326433-Amphidinium_carterae.1